MMKHSYKMPLIFLFEKKAITLMLLGLLVLASAMGVIYNQYLNRRLHIELQQLQEAKNALHVEWTQLLLEEGTLSSDVQVEKIAREKLGMFIPPSQQIVVIKP